MSVVWIIFSQRERKFMRRLTHLSSVPEKPRESRKQGKSKRVTEEQRENTRWLREWDINHTAKRKREGTQKKKKKLVEISGTDLRCIFCSYSSLHPILWNRMWNLFTLVTACSGDKASNNSDASRNDKSGGPSAIATASREWLLFNLFFFFPF